MEGIFFEITIIICIAATLSIVFRLLKQPAILAYILTGVLLGPVGLFHLQNQEALNTLGQLGITLLLFMLGLELKLGELKSIGKTALISGTLQMWFTFIAGFFLALLLGLDVIAAIFTGIAVSFSSTIIIVKILSDKKDLTSLYGKIAVGILLLQDFVAVLALIFLSDPTLLSGSTVVLQMGLLLTKITILVALVLYLSEHIFPRITHIIAKSPESLFLFSLAWVFALTAVVSSSFVGFSIEIGGFLAGLALANTHENFQIIGKMKALRDFFITIFFVMLGLQMNFANFQQILLPAFIISLFVLLIKPLIVMCITGMLGYRKRTSFLVGLSMGQISEFSLILLFVGGKFGLISQEVITMLILVCMITFTLSTYMIDSANILYHKLHKYLDFLEGEQTEKNSQPDTLEVTELKGHIVIVGAHQMGQSILRALEEEGETVIMVDFDPDLVTRLKKQGTSVFFGDIADTEIQERASLQHAKLVISTVPDLEDNLLLIQGMNQMNRRAKIVVMAYEVDEAKILYKAGADYVVLPHLAGGRHLAKILMDNKHLELIEMYKRKDLSAIV